MLEKDGEADLDRSYEKWGNVTKGEGEEEYPTDNKKKEGELNWCGPGSSVGIATGYGLDGPGIESRLGGRDFPHLSRPIHPASCTMGTGSFPAVKSSRGRTLTPHPLLVPWSWKDRAIPLLHLWAVRPVQSLSACTRVHFTLPQCLYKGTLYLTLTGMVISCVGTALWNTFWRKEGRYKWREDEEEDVSIDWMTLRKREDTRNWKRKHQIALCGELDLERGCGPVVRQTAEWMNITWSKVKVKCTFQGAAQYYRMQYAIVCKICNIKYTELNLQQLFASKHRFLLWNVHFPLPWKVAFFTKSVLDMYSLKMVTCITRNMLQ